MPDYALAILIEQLPALQAAEQLDAIGSASAPHMEKRDRQRVIRRLQRELVRHLPPPPKPEFVRHDPEAAARWFAERGFRVVRSEDAEKVDSA